jgi:2-pyrone-4,6-dicarboxylate lactonase
VDAHCHVFGPGAVFPYHSARKYTPCDASAAQLFALRDHLGLSRNVIVQATCHGPDNRALVDALQRSEGRARGIAVVAPEASDAELRALDQAGVRGVRFNFVKRLVDDTPRAVFRTMAARVAALGWHVVVYFEAPDLPDLEDFLAEMPCTVVVDHMGRPDVAQGSNSADFARFMALMAANDHIWVKVSCPERLTVAGPPYDDVVPFSRKLVAAFPDRVLWGTDWPPPNMKSHMPDDGVLVDQIPRLAPDALAQHKLLVANPMRLYWPEEG